MMNNNNAIEFNQHLFALERPHLNLKVADRPHICPVPTCAKRFTTSGNLSRHKRLHGCIEPLKCPVDGCVCTFKSYNKLEKHMKFHYGGDVKVCTVAGCGKTFSTSGNLNRHLKRNHNQSCIDGYESPASTISPTSRDHWSPSAVTDCLYDDDVCDLGNLWNTVTPTTTPLEFADETWTPELLDALASILDDADCEY